jgi:hypothetical protein
MTTTTAQSINRGSYGINILLSYSLLKAMTNITTNLTGMVLYQITTARHRETQGTRLLLINIVIFRARKNSLLHKQRDVAQSLVFSVLVGYKVDIIIIR